MQQACSPKLSIGVMLKSYFAIYNEYGLQLFTSSSKSKIFT